MDEEQSASEQDEPVLRIDHWQDPTAPRANSVVPTVTVRVRSPDGRVLLVRNEDNGKWGPPSGPILLGSDIQCAATDHVKEQSGHLIEVFDFFGIFNDALNRVEFPLTGEVRQELDIVLMADLDIDARRSPDVDPDRIRWLPIVEALELRPMTPAAHRTLLWTDSLESPVLEPSLSLRDR